MPLYNPAAAGGGDTRKIIVPPACMSVTASPSAYPLTNFGTFARFNLASERTLRWVRLRIGTSSGNFQACIASITETRGATNKEFGFTRVMNSGVISCPAAGEVVAVDLGATVCAAGDYIVWVWLSDGLATVANGTSESFHALSACGSKEVGGGMPASDEGFPWSWGNRMPVASVEVAS